MRKRTPPAERFWPKVDKSAGPNGCWIWQAGRNAGGYGVFGVGLPGQQWNEMAHRFAWELEHGPIPAGLLACHRCDNPPCVNPAHLFLGRHADNTADMMTKGRAAWSGRTHCTHGHELTDGVVYIDRRGRRQCKTCRNLASKAFRERNPGRGARAS